MSLFTTVGKYLTQCLLKSSYISVAFDIYKMVVLTLVSQPSLPRALLTS